MDEYRARIDAIDSRIIELLGQRREVSRAIGDYKRSHGLKVADPQREWALQERIRQLAAEHGADPQLCIRLYGLILSNSRAQQ